MKYIKEKQDIIDTCIEMMNRGLSKLTGGNVSTITREDGVMLITPASTPYHTMKVEDIVEIDLEGNVLNQDELDKIGRYKSSEWEMHLSAYKAREDITAFIHAHPIASMALSAVVDELPAIDYLIANTGSHIVPTVRYETYGTPELAEASTKKLKYYNAVLLQNHGINVVSEKGLAQALKIAINVEFLAEMYWRASIIGKPNIIPKHKMDEVLAKFQDGENADK